MSTVTQIRVPGCMGARDAIADISGFEQNDRWVMEPKYDGFRLLTILDPSFREGVKGFTRRGTEPQYGTLQELLPRVYHTLQRRLVDRALRGHTVLDGELVGGDDGNDFTHVGRVMKSLKDRAIQLQRDEGWLTYIVFDVLFWNGEDTRDWSLQERQRLITRELLPRRMDGAIGANVRIAPCTPVLESQIRFWQGLGFEGAILKNLDAPYVQGKPQNTWYKVKGEWDADVVVTGFTDGKPGKGIRRMTDTIGAIKFGQYRECRDCAGQGGALGLRCVDCDGTGMRLIERGQTSGMDDEVRFGILDRSKGIDRRDEYLGRVMVVSHKGMQKNYRHPQFERFRDDKPAAECTWEDA